MLDPDGIVSSWNPGAERFKGYEASEIIGQHFRTSTNEDDARRLPQRALETAAREGKFEGEGWRVRKDGSRFWAYVVIDPIRDGRRAPRLRQDHARPHRATGGRGGAAAQRGAVPAAGPGRHATTPSTCSTPAASSPTGTPAPSASRATRRTRSSASTSRASIPRRTAPRRAGAQPRDRRARGPLREGRLARPQGRHALLGQCRHRRDPRRRAG